MSKVVVTDEQTLVRLMTAYGTDIKRLCLCLLNDSFLAEDAAQETFVKAWRNLPGFRQECSEKTWLCRIAVNTCRSMQRGFWFRSVITHAPGEKPVTGTEPPPRRTTGSICGVSGFPSETFLRLLRPIL